MRAAVVALVAACASPDIATGSYACGPEQLCPPGQKCNGPDNTCVLAGTEQPFACDPTVLNEPDDTIDQAVALSKGMALPCPSTPTLVPGCLATGDAANWVSFSVASSCPPIAAQIQVVYPLAFERMALELWQTDNGPTMLASDSACASTMTAPGDTSSCVTNPIVAGGHYAVLVKPGGGDCGGSCAFNRYELSVQVVAQ